MSHVLAHTRPCVNARFSGSPGDGRSHAVKPDQPGRSDHRREKAMIAWITLLCLVGFGSAFVFTLALCKAAARGDEQMGIKD